MAGLMEQGTTTAADVPPRGAPAGGAEDVVGDNEDVREEASPEEQAQYDEFVKSGLRLIADQGDGILDLLDEDPTDLKAVLGDAIPQEVTPPLALGAAAVIVVLETLRRAGEKPSDEIIMHGGKEILEALADLAEKAGEQDYSQEQLNQAWLMGLDLYREVASAEGLIDNEALKGQFDELVTADKEGRLGEVLPGLDKAQLRDGQQSVTEGEDNGGVR